MIAHRHGRCDVGISDQDDSIVLRAQAHDGALVGVRLPAGAASQLGQRLQLAAARVVARHHAGRTDVMHLATTCFDCGAEFMATSGGDLRCGPCRTGFKRHRVGHAQRQDEG